jgi:hypothetical protein
VVAAVRGQRMGTFTHSTSGGSSERTEDGDIHSLC